jgi:hypothetical protein
MGQSFALHPVRAISPPSHAPICLRKRVTSAVISKKTFAGRFHRQTSGGKAYRLVLRMAESLLKIAQLLLKTCFWARAMASTKRCQT